MTTASEAIPATEVTAAPRRRSWLRFAGGFAIGIGIGALVIAGALLAWDWSYQGRILPGVRVQGIDLSGLDHDAAIAALEPASATYGQGRVVLRTATSDRLVSFATFGRRLDTEAMVATAMATGRQGGPIERAIEELSVAFRGNDVGPALTLDREALGSRIAFVLSVLERAPVDATIRMQDGVAVTTPSRIGRTFDAAAATDAAYAVASRLDAPSDIVIGVGTVDVAPIRSDRDVQAAKAESDRVAVDLVVGYGSKTWTIKAKTVRSWLDFANQADGSVGIVVDSAAIGDDLGAVAKGVAKKAVSAGFLTSKRGTVVGVTPSQDGRELDVDATKAAIAAAIDQRIAGGAPVPVGATVKAIAPKVSTAEAQKTAPLMTMLGSWKTWFPISERNHYGANIWLPAKYIDGTVLAPGQRFEWWSAIGPVTTARGFGLGGIIKSDHTEPTGAMGGGMCSSSTTLFNAALRAGLQMGARSNHKYYINRYPLGLDATVSGGSARGQTMSFVNDTGHPIIIRGYRIGGTSGKGWVRYEIWGIPDGRKVSISAPTVRNVRKAVTNTVYVSTLPHGVREQTEFPSDGKDVWVTRTVRDAHGKVIHRETYVSHYMLWNGRIEIGI